MANQKEVASHLDLSDRTVRELLQKGAIPRPRGRAGYNLDACRLAYIRHLREVAAGRQSTDGKLDLTAERARESKERADKLALENAEKRRELIPAGAVVSTWARMVESTKSQIRAVPSQAKARIPSLRVKDVKVLQKLHDEALRELAGNGLPPGAGEGMEDGLPGVGAAAASNR